MGIRGVSNGDERVAGAVELVGEGATAGIILGEEITREAV
jgi:hypothetical protein